MRYGPDQKARSRAALVEAAAELFRKFGYNGIGIDALCRQAGLTRGAFYAHFRSKAELFSAVLGGAHDLLARLRNRRRADAQGLAREGAQIVGDYLHEAHRQAVLGGCSLASLAADTVRAEPAAQAAYAATVQAIVDEMCRGSAAPSRRDAEAALALCVGGLLVGAACGAAPVGTRISRAARRQAMQLLQSGSGDAGRNH